MALTKWNYEGGSFCDNFLMLRTGYSRHCLNPNNIEITELCIHLSLAFCIEEHER